MRYVGIDPSTKTGLVILNELGEVEEEKEITTPIKTDPGRFIDIAKRVMDVLNTEDFISIEGFSYGSKGQGVSIQYGIGWITRALLLESGFDYIEVPPSSLKKFTTGKGTEKKENMILPIYKQWGFESDSDNVRDAFVLAQISRALNGKGEILKRQEDVIKKIKKEG